MNRHGVFDQAFRDSNSGSALSHDWLQRENLAGVAMANHPTPVNNGESEAYTGVPWKDGKAKQMLIAKAGEQEQILLASFRHK